MGQMGSSDYMRQTSTSRKCTNH